MRTIFLSKPLSLHFLQMRCFFSIFAVTINVVSFMLKKIGPVIAWVKRHKYLSVTIMFLLVIFIIDDKNMFKHYKNQYVISELEEEIETMKRDSAEIVMLQSQMDFRGDIEAVEELARDKHGMHKDNEDVFVVEE